MKNKSLFLKVMATCILALGLGFLSIGDDAAFWACFVSFNVFIAALIKED